MIPLKSSITTTCQRIFIHSEVGRRKKLAYETALNERSSVQVVLRHETGNPLKVQVEALPSKGFNVRVRRVGYVPLPHFNTPVLSSQEDRDGMGMIPGLVPDPLFEESSFTLPSHETHAFWLTITPKARVEPGPHRVTIKVIPEKGKTHVLEATVTLHPIRLKKRVGFPITHWMYVDSIMDWYQTDHFDERFWSLLESYMSNIVEHGQDTLYVPVFTPPLDEPRRPSQLLKIRKRPKGKYDFDWRDVKRYVDLARKKGISCFEWSHLFSQWGVMHAIKVYEKQGEERRLLWPESTGATSKRYRHFLSQFLPELHDFLKREKLLKKSFFHVSDEPHGEKHLANYRAARQMLKELAPWMKVMDAMSQTEFADEIDLPVPIISALEKFEENGIDSWCYYCCYPRAEWLNRLMDTPLAKIAMHGLLFYKSSAQGFLHWGYNYWCKSKSDVLIDPFNTSDGCAWPDWAYGDTFQVYPGPDGPIDSIRWEIFAESLQDYQLLQTLGVDPDDPRLAPLKSFKDFPKNERWRRQLRRQLLVEKK